MCEHDYNWILSDLAVGNINAGTNLKTLLKNGIDVIVCVVPTLPYPIKVYQDNGFSLFHIPIDDNPEVDIQRWFDDVTYFIMLHRLMNRKVLVHCMAGISRSTTLACAYLMNLLHFDEINAVFWCRSKRPCTNMNSGFLRQLREYGKKFKKK